MLPITGNHAIHTPDVKLEVVAASRYSDHKHLSKTKEAQLYGDRTQINLLHCTRQHLSATTNSVHFKSK